MKQMLNAKKCSKVLFSLLITVAVFSGVFISSEPNLSQNHTLTPIVHAQEGEYDGTYQFMQPLEVLGFGSDNGVYDPNDEGFAEYVDSIIQTIIGFVILLAVIMVMVSGIQYMTAKSVTKTSDAKESMTKALGGLILALSAVTILQTINPNLVEINPLQEIEVEEGSVGFDIGDSHDITWNPSGTGLYYCFSHDSWGLNDYACTENNTQCENAREIDANSYSECRPVMYYRGGYDDENIDSDDYCTGYILNEDENDGGVRCFDAIGECSSFRGQGFNRSNFTGCKPPSNFGEGGGTDENEGVVSANQQLQQHILNGNPPEEDVRQMLYEQEPTIYTNRGGESDPREGNYCTTVTSTACTNLGGLDQIARIQLQTFNQDFTNSPYCNNTDCRLIITGGTSWWFHGNENYNPTNNGSTHHNPVGLELPSGAVDFRPSEPLNNYIREQLDITGGSGCHEGNYFLDELGGSNAHWHVVFDSPNC